MPRWLKHFFFILLLVVFSGCAGSCSGCSGCGVTPLAGGFDTSKQVENATSVRLTQSGLKFLSDNLGPLAGNLIGTGNTSGIVTFNVPTSKSDIKDPIFGATIGSVTVCPSGPNPTANPPDCVVEIDLSKAKLAIVTGAPHDILVTGTIAVRLQHLPISGSGVGALASGASAALDNGGKCGPYDYANVPVDIDVSLETDTDPTHTGRLGYTKVVIKKLNIDQNSISSSLTFCGGFTSTILNVLKPLLIGQLIGGLTGSLSTTVQDQLCTKADPTTGTTCPTGSTPDSSNTCMWPDKTCVGMALGTDGNIDLESALASLSPGTKGGFDFLAALGGQGTRDNDANMTWGDLDPVANGATLGMLGGAEPTPIATCVPIAQLTRPSDIPIPDEIRANTVSNWTGAGPDVGIAVSERYINYLLGSVYNSGALCLGVGSSTLGSMLNSNTLGLLIPSLKDLGRQKQAQPLALMVRPQKPPTVKVGNGTDLAKDPLLQVTMPQLTIDFYIWSSDRYIRAFSSSFDVVVPVNLDVNDKSQLAPVLDKIDVSNPKIFNAPLLREDEAAAAKALAGIIASQVGGSLGGAISPVDLNSQLASLGIQLTIPPTVKGQGSPGLRLLTKGTDNFLGIFGTFGTVSGPTVPLLRSHTTVELVSKKVDPAGLVLSTITPDNRPKVEIRVGSTLDTGAQPIEYSYRLDGGFWHEWTSERYITLDSPILSLQARHKVDVRSRVVGEPTTVDAGFASLEVLIDKSPPDIDLATHVEGDQLRVDVSDVVSPKKAIQVRWALDNAAYGEWQSADQLDNIPVGQAQSISVQAKDEEGNVAQKQQGLIRGRQDAALAPASACGCRVPGDARSSGTGYGLGAILALGLLFGLRRRGGRDDDDDPRGGSRNGGSKSRVGTLRVAAALGAMLIAASWSGCSCGSSKQSNKKPSDCPTCEQILPGLVGSYSSAAVSQGGTVWVAGYDDIGYTQGPDAGANQVLFGDLVVGKWDGSKVDWQSVDGLPAVDPTLDPGTPGGPPDPTYYDPKGFRQGLTDPGDDVGMWTSIVLDSSGNPEVAYYDATHRALKFASYDGSSWSMHTVESDDHGDIGRYAKMLLVDGKPTIAYLSIMPGGTNGTAKSSVRVATASTATPAAASDWSFADAASAPSVPCHQYNCNTGEYCRVDTGACEKTTTGCTPSCASGQKCFDANGTPTCTATLSSTAPEDYPNAYGLYVSMAATSSGLGIVYYDRVHGNLYAISDNGGTWTQPLLLDGQGKDAQGNDIDTGDVGIGASLFIDPSGDWHVSYVNGFTEAVMYQLVKGGTTAGTPEVVDAGNTADGQAVVGDDSAIDVTGSGEVHVAYQDATSGQLDWAVGTPKSGGTGHDWTSKSLTVETEAFAGAFNHILSVNGATQVMTWWRKGKPLTVGDVKLVSP